MIELSMFIFISAIAIFFVFFILLMRGVYKKPIKKGHFIKKPRFLEETTALKMRSEYYITESLKKAQKLTDVEKLVACVISNLTTQDLEEAIKDPEIPQFERDLCMNEKYYRTPQFDIIK